MAQTKPAQVSSVNFSGGWVPDASPLAPPENSLSNTLNMYPKLGGGIQRRRGLHPIADTTYYAMTGADPYTDYTEAFYWSGAGNTKQDLLVVRCGAKGAVYQVERGAPKTLYGVFEMFTSTPTSRPLAFTVISGILVLGIEYKSTDYGSNPAPCFKVYAWNEADNEPEVTSTIPCLVRDLWGIGDGTNPFTTLAPYSSGGASPVTIASYYVLFSDSANPRPPTEDSGVIPVYGSPFSIKRHIETIGRFSAAATIGAFVEMELYVTDVLTGDPRPQPTTFFRIVNKFDEGGYEVLTFDGTHVETKSDYSYTRRTYTFKVTTRSSGATDNSRRYNLHNAGWPLRYGVISHAEDETVSQANPVNTIANKGAYPALSSVFWFFTEASTTKVRSRDAFNIERYNNTRDGYSNFEPPAGKFIISPLNRDSGRGVAVGGAAVWTDRDFGKVNNMATYAGRVWHTFEVEAGESISDRTPTISSMVFYSQLVTDSSTIGKCHSKNDPTSEDANSPLETDGGFISIPEMRKVTALVPFGETLLVIAENGVWQIGGSDSSFSATNQRVTKVSSTGSRYGASVVLGEGFVAYWGDNSIQGVTSAEGYYNAQVQSLSQGKLDSLVDSLSEEEKLGIRGVYDTTNKTAKWIIPESDFGYSRELVLDLKSSGFFLSEYFAGPDASTSRIFDAVSSTYPLTKTVGEASSAMYLCVRSGPEPELSFWGPEGDSFTDFEVEGTGGEVGAYAVTSPVSGGESQRDKVVKYVTIHLERTESEFVGSDELGWEAKNDSSCLLQYRWNWTDDANAAAWSTEEECYVLPRTPNAVAGTQPWDTYGHTVISNKKKVRGTGLALSLAFKATPGKDLSLLGWSYDMKAEATV